MTGARAALEAARAAAVIARREPTNANRQAVRVALSAARYDAVGASVGGVGYNPYRDKGGKFAPGAHKAKPTAGEKHAAALAKAQERVGKAKATVDKHAGKLTAAHQARQSALAETRTALDKARGAAELARANPTAKNIKAAQVATNKATRASAKVGKADAAIDKGTAAHAKATSAHAKAVEAHAAVRAKAPADTGAPVRMPVPTPVPKSATRAVESGQHEAAQVTQSAEGAAASAAFRGDGARRALIAEGRTGGDKAAPDGTRSAQYRPEAQKAIREHHDAVIAAYGTYNHDGRPGAGQAGKTVVAEDHMMYGGHQVYGSHGTSGDVMLWGGVADHLSRHAALSPAELHDVGRKAMAGDKEAVRMVDAYRVSTHEVLHGHGPPFGGGNQGTMVDEISTEMTARRVVGDLHGIPSDRMQGSYDRFIHPVVDEAAKASGRSKQEAWKAVEGASLAHKQRKNYDDVDGQVDAHFGGEVLKRLGVHDPAAHDAFAEKMYKIGSNEYQKSVDAKYPSVNRYK